MIIIKQIKHQILTWLIIFYAKILVVPYFQSIFLRILNLDKYFLGLLNKGIISMGHARVLIGKTPDNFDEKTLSIISSGKISVRDLEKNKRRVKNHEPNLIQEEKNLSSTIGFKTKITFNKKGKGNIKIFYDNLEQYNFLITKLKN